MEGKKIVKTSELGQGYMITKFDDNTFAFIHVIEPELQEDELLDLVGPPSEDRADKKSKKEPEPESKKEPEKEPEGEGDAFTWEDLKKMDIKELKGMVKEYKLDTDSEDFEEDEENEFRRAIAKEIGVDIPSKKPKEEPEEEKEAEKEDDKYTWEMLKKLDYDELSDLVEEENLDTDPKDYDTDEESEFRKAIAEELKISLPPKRKV